MATLTKPQLMLPDSRQLNRFARLYGPALSAPPAFPGEGEQRLQRPGPGNEFYEYRDYQPGDDSRRLDWRKSMLRGRGQVRHLQQHYQSDWYICLDTSASMLLSRLHKFELAAQLAAAVGYTLLERGNRVGLLQFSNSLDSALQPGRGRYQYQHICRQLLAANDRPGGTGSNLAACAEVAGKNGSGLFIISDFVGFDANFNGLDQLCSKHRQLHALQIISNHELELPNSDSGRLRDAETGAVITLQDTALAQQQAAQRLADVQTRLRAHCAKRGIQLSQANTDQDWIQVLSQHLQLARVSPG
jgi:uncharacterized protein (DUF58 family)